MHDTVTSYTVFIWLMALVVAMVLVARVLRIPSPVALVLGGVAVAFLPSLPPVPLDPKLVFLIVLPPLLAEAAYFISIRDLRANLRPIALLAVGLVVATSVSVAWLMTLLVPGLPFAAGMVLGAVVSPPDAVAATSITRHVRIPRRVIAILEGESLINDATALTIYQFAVAAVVTGSFSLLAATGEFAWKAVGGILIGALIGKVFLRLFRYIHDSEAAVVATFLLAYVSYLSAEMFHASGVLATVVASLLLSWHSSETFAPDFRIRAIATWKTVIFVLNGLVFILIGLQFPSILAALSDYRITQLLAYTLLLSAALIVVRLLWVFAVAHGTRWLVPGIRRRDPTPPWQYLFLLGWTGLRGVITLAAAMALPLLTASGAPFPGRDLMIFLAFAVIFITLVGQGMTLPWVVHRLKLPPDTRLIQEEWEARKALTDEALRALDAMRSCAAISENAYQRILSHYRDRLELLGDGPNTPLGDEPHESGTIPTIVAAEQRLWREVLKVERGVLVGLRKAGQVSDEVMRAIENEIDLLDARFLRYRA